jgi:hypothetical protein
VAAGPRCRGGQAPAMGLMGKSSMVLDRARVGATAVAARCHSEPCHHAGSGSHRSEWDGGGGAGEKRWRHAGEGEEGRQGRAGQAWFPTMFRDGRSEGKAEGGGEDGRTDGGGERGEDAGLPADGWRDGAREGGRLWEGGGAAGRMRGRVRPRADVGRMRRCGRT